ncbi:putative aminotransferase [Lachnospiraceae bacterium]|uniref:aminotransferase class I/II-fold pyridoxal phosphate-dependent enzyme n=1 Tax=Extibacter sp. GGCC_0201 TaxID=2731209 RepID=UPI001AA14F2A|nr:aminotransferase class I/II-fold pyridoxal phosphate-dependent enzyme [Extibacter sp. GGCC_0201]MBO1722333.1 aminotransferase class I/II-fold pyridoxal phosphate-dependent enzyme [Extibacter sp. GGCC_0201]BDF32800.1 putative aminotransferase [Lachnospiraceae bacterium]BDF36805.1 putative aminotransferase [Lachnospiraceae bacterium]
MIDTSANTTSLEQLKDAYEDARGKHLKLNMSRGKPAPSQLDLSNALLGALDSYITEDGTDARNYGILDGIPECRRLFADLLDLNPDRMIIGGNSSLSLMFDTAAALSLFGTGGNRPWQHYRYAGTPVKFLCPSPGYDRHFRICEELGIEMIPIPLNEEGPDMDLVTTLVRQDPLIKGIWCVPLHSNPGGVCYSSRVVEQLASMETAARDFRIFWDNAYGIHHIYEEVPLKNILDACERHGHPERAYYFFSTSKITFPGAGVALIASGPGNIKELKGHMSAQIISYDKLNQLRHVRHFKTPENIRAHMAMLADELRPKFDLVLSKLETELKGTGFASWSRPKGGYFISLDTRPGCAKRTVALAKDAGVVLTDAGATYPYGRDEKDSNIRIAPSYPTLEELAAAMDIFILCIKIAALETNNSK